jgi:hypothetical protein
MTDDVISHRKTEPKSSRATLVRLARHDVAVQIVLLQLFGGVPLYVNLASLVLEGVDSVGITWPCW